MSSESDRGTYCKSLLPQLTVLVKKNARTIVVRSLLGIARALIDDLVFLHREFSTVRDSLYQLMEQIKQFSSFVGVATLSLSR